MAATISPSICLLAERPFEHSDGACANVIPLSFSQATRILKYPVGATVLFCMQSISQRAGTVITGASPSQLQTALVDFLARCLDDFFPLDYIVLQ
jgi:hypothetical protein